MDVRIGDLQAVNIEMNVIKGMRKTPEICNFYNTGNNKAFVNIIPYLHSYNMSDD